MNGAYIFIDEYGNTHLDLSKAGTFSHFIFVAVIFPGDKYSIALETRNEISRKYAQGHPFKTKRFSLDQKIGAIYLLKELNPVIMALVVDKAKVVGTGLNYHTIFYKYFQKMLIYRMSKIYEEIKISIVADTHGTLDFMKSLTKFVQSELSLGDLFIPDKHYTIADDKIEEPLLQLADLAANVAGNIFCLSHMNEDRKLLFQAIQPYLFVDFFPYDSLTEHIHQSLSNQDTNNKISDLATSSVLSYLERELYMGNFIHRDILEHILLNFLIDKDRLVPSSELIEVGKKINPDFTEYQLRQAIASFRDNRALVMSLKGKHGYKLPSCAADVVSFYNRFGNNLIPMLKRISSIDRVFREQSFNELDLLSQSEDYTILRSLIGALTLKN